MAYGQVKNKDSHFAQNNFDAALRFFDAVRQTCAKLAQSSGMGRPDSRSYKSRAKRVFEKYQMLCGIKRSQSEVA